MPFTGYCLLADVNQLVPQQPFGPATVPTDTDVEQFILDIGAEMNATLGNMGYLVPVDATASPLAFAECVKANKWGALGIAQDARMTAVLRDDMVGGGKNAWTIRYYTWVKNLTDSKHPYELPDAQRNAFAIVKPLGQIESSTVDNPDYDYPTNPPFSIGMKL
jgi:hypothetical protein